MTPILLALAGLCSLSLCILYVQISKLKYHNQLVHQTLQETSKNYLQQISADISRLQGNLHQHFHNAASTQQQKFESFTLQMNELVKFNEIKLHHLQETVVRQLETIRADNQQKLEAIRSTVEEKLHDTLEKRLNKSFEIISQRLEVVHRSMGEMQTLAAGVGDLKRVLTNIKTRGIWGEAQLAAIIEQLLIPEQFAQNVQVDPNTNARVEFAVKMPGERGAQAVWLPIDAKFPIEVYQKLMLANEEADLALINLLKQELTTIIKKCAKTISQLYIKPPYTTEFALMFLPVEGMYAEVLRYPGLFEQIQQEYRVVITGPTTLSAILNSLQMGFRTLAIQHRSSEVWQLLSSIKTEFGKFGELLAKTRQKLEQATKVIGDAESKTRVINRKLRDVESTPQLTNLDEEVAADAD